MLINYETHTLANGLRVIFMPTASEVTYCGYAIKAGARNEEAGEDGLAHFCEHMTFKGTDRLTPIKVINTLESVGGELNAYTAKEETVYYAAILHQHFNKAVDLLTEIVFNSTYPETELEKEREVVCDEIESYRDSPAELIYDDFENIIFKGTSLGHNVLGSKDSVRNFHTSSCKSFTNRLYRPDNSVFYVVGNEKFSRIIKRLESLFSNKDHLITDNTQQTQPLILPTLTEKKVLMNEMQTHQSHVMIGTAFCNDMEKWRIPLYLTNNILGGPSMNSRLNISLREKRGLVYTVESIMTSYSDCIAWSTYFGCDHDDVNRCLRLVRNQLNKLRDTTLTVDKLNAAKRQIKGQIALACENRENYAIDMAKQFLHRNTLKNTDTLYRKIDEVSSQQIQELAESILNTDRLFTLIYS